MERIQNGYLEVILGPMFSGKTSKLVEIYKQYTFCNIPVMVINHQEDNRYSTDSVMVTHDAVKIKCVQCNTLSSILESKMELFSQAPPVILINEGQFFPVYTMQCTPWYINIKCTCMLLVWMGIFDKKNSVKCWI